MRQARAFRSINIVSFDWLEDSLMKHTPLSARNYMLENIVKAKFLEKTRKRVKKKENIDQGSKSQSGCQNPLHILTVDSGTVREGLHRVQRGHEDG